MRPVLLIRLAALALLLAAFPAAPAAGETARIAVATNFAEPAQALAEAFAAETGHTLVLSTGSTGTLYAQIAHGAPFDVFLAADTVRPARLVEAGRAVADSRRTYAVGRLALWTLDSEGEPPLQRLRAGRYRRLALANPELAPYGAAARQVLDRFGAETADHGRRVLGANIGQTHAFVATGNADLGFVALSQLHRPDTPPDTSLDGRYELIPADWHDPIRQDAVLLVRGADNPAARAWLAFLATPHARDIIASYGYEVPE
jgi:molybdate transport system substrate-binding protein